jgi:biotin/methionine sulfoxide reductase
MDAGPVNARGKIAGRETLAINPVDARSRGIGDGEVVRVFNARGACFAGVSVTDSVRPGVVRLSCGAWYDPAGDEDEPACAHGNANVFTRDHGTSRPSQGPSSATALVEVAKCADPPPLRAFCAGAAGSPGLAPHPEEVRGWTGPPSQGSGMLRARAASRALPRPGAIGAARP